MSLEPLPRSLTFLRSLIGFDSLSSKSTENIVDYLVEYLASQGLQPRRLPTSRAGKENLFVTIPSHDGSADGGVMLSGHLDVVPVEGQDWSTDPFELVVRDGKAYGRGTSDMKAFIAGVLEFIPDLMSRPLKMPVHIALTCDEEIGCLGAFDLVEQLGALGIKPDMCIVGEPTQMQVVTAHKSSNLYEIVVNGIAAHSSLTPQGVNAIEYAAEAVRFIRGIADRNRIDGPFDSNYDIPFTTANTGIINGGIAVNTVAEQCKVQYEYRTIDALPPENVATEIKNFVENDLGTRMKAENPQASAEIIELATVPGLRQETDNKAEQLVVHLLGHNKTQTVAYATEAGIYQAMGIQTIVCGPGNIDQAHKVDEFVELSQLLEFEDLLEALIADLQHFPN